MVNAVGPLGRARSRRNQGKVDEARRKLKRKLDDEHDEKQKQKKRWTELVSNVCSYYVLVHIL